MLVINLSIKSDSTIKKSSGTRNTKKPSDVKKDIVMTVILAAIMAAAAATAGHFLLGW